MRKTNICRRGLLGAVCALMMTSMGMGIANYCCYLPDGAQPNFYGACYATNEGSCDSLGGHGAGKNFCHNAPNCPS